jgi:hypothetical protein
MSDPEDTSEQARSPKSLLDLLRDKRINVREFEQIVLSHFSRAMHVAPNAVVYPNDASDFALKITYDKHDNIQSITGGPALKDDDIATLIRRLESDVIPSAGTKVGAVVLFANRPVNGFFKYADVFQILPLPPDAPRPKYPVGGGYPFLLEFTFSSSADVWLSVSRRMVVGRELELFVCGIVSNSIHDLTSQHHWVMTSEPDVQPMTVGYCQEAYAVPGLKRERDAYSDLDGIARISQLPPSEFFGRRGVPVGQDLDVPSNLEELYRTFSNLPEADRQRFLASCFWYQHASRVIHFSRSAYFTALISAVEALVPRPTGQPQCPSCKRTTGPGPTQQFADFLETFAPGPGEMKRLRKDLYSIRSRLSHDGALLRSDTRRWSPRFSPSVGRESDDLSNASSIVRVTLVNWLLLSPHANGDS